MTSVFNEKMVGGALGHAGIVLFLKKNTNSGSAMDYEMFVAVLYPPPNSTESLAPLIIELIGNEVKVELIVGICGHKNPRDQHIRIAIHSALTQLCGGKARVALGVPK